MYSKFNVAILRQKIKRWEMAKLHILSLAEKTLDNAVKKKNIDEINRIFIKGTSEEIQKLFPANIGKSVLNDIILHRDEVRGIIKLHWQFFSLKQYSEEQLDLTMDDLKILSMDPDSYSSLLNFAANCGHANPDFDDEHILASLQNFYHGMPDLVRLNLEMFIYANFKKIIKFLDTGIYNLQKKYFVTATKRLLELKSDCSLHSKNAIRTCERTFFSSKGGCAEKSKDYATLKETFF